jgi:hypothetical protein
LLVKIGLVVIGWVVVHLLLNSLIELIEVDLALEEELEQYEGEFE